MEIKETQATITATGCGQYNRTIEWTIGDDNLWHLRRSHGGTRPGWSKSKVMGYLNDCWA